LFAGLAVAICCGLGVWWGLAGGLDHRAAVPVPAARVRAHGQTTLAGAPAALRAAVERSLGAGATRWRPQSAPLRASYGGASVTLAGAGWSGSVGLGQVGRAGAMKALTGAAARGSGGASYRAGDVEESFARTPAGIEQSFTIARRPAGAGQLAIEIPLTGLRASGSGALIALRSTGGRTVADYSGLRVTDATGRVLHASMSSSGAGRRIVISVADGPARYPIRVDPTYWAQNGQLTDPDTTDNDFFGYSVAISGDTAVIGAPQGTSEYGSPYNFGAPTLPRSGNGNAYIFTYSGGSWNLAASIANPDDDANDAFGYSVAVSGSTVVVGDPFQSVNGNADEGAAYAYTFSAGTLSPLSPAPLTDGGTDAYFGASVATSGSTIAVGAYEADEGSGEVYVYALSAGNWSETGELVPPVAQDQLGWSVGIAATGTTVVAGALDYGDDNNDAAADLYTLSAGNWSFSTELNTGIGSAGEAPQVAIDLPTIAIGVPYSNQDPTSYQFLGQTQIWTLSGTTWGNSATLPDPPGALFDGAAVAVSGSTVVVGAPETSGGGGATEGATYVYEGGGSSWTLDNQIAASNGDGGDQFGFSVAVSGSSVISGAPRFGYQNGVGASAFVYTPSPPQAGPTFTVTTTADTDDGGCFVAYCSLRDAINAANDLGDAGDTIDFDIPGGGVQVISPTTQLPSIDEALVIDGESQPGYSGTPLIELDGTDCVTNGCDGLDFTYGPNTVEGLAVVGFPYDGIVLDGDFGGAGSTIENDWIGWSAASNGFDGNGNDGILIDDSPKNTIHDVVAGGNDPGSSMYTSGADIEISGGPPAIACADSHTSCGNVVTNSYIGVSPDGMTPSDDRNGVEIDTGASDNTIGGSESAGNLIYGDYAEGVYVTSGASNVIAGNTIGADASGNVGFFHSNQGIGVVGGATGTVIGDSAAPGSLANTTNGNVIVGQDDGEGDGEGIYIDTSNVSVAGNFIGTDRNGDSGLGNAEGVEVDSGANIVIGPGNTIADNSGDGVYANYDGTTVTGNSIYGNMAGITGPTTGESATAVAPPVLSGPPLQSGTVTAINGTVSGAVGAQVAVEFFDGSQCDPSGSGEGTTYLGSTTVTIGSDGTATVSVASTVPNAGDVITATATTTLPSQGSATTSNFSQCASVISGGPNNYSWTTAETLTPGTPVNESINLSGQARWYKVPVTPGGTIQVNLTNLPANYDLTLFSDIGQAEQNITSSSLQTIEAQTPGNAFSPSVFSPSVFSPSVFSPSVFSPSVFSPSVFSPSVFSPSVFSPSVFSPSVFSPSVFSPSVFSPSVFSPSVFSPSVFSPSVFSPSVSIPDERDYEGAQIQSLLAVSDNGGTADQQIYDDVWNHTGDFYIRVNGPNGDYDPGKNFTLNVTENNGTCQNVAPSTATLYDPGSLPAASYKTLVLTNFDRMGLTGAQESTMQGDLATFEAWSSVDGQSIDLDTISPRVVALETQVAAHPDCAYAENLVAEAIRDIVLAVRAQANSQLQYIVIVGDDHVIPFFRYPDTAGVGPESGYSPPVLALTPSDTSLESNDFLSQDAYGSTADLDIQGAELPLPDLPVGRLSETPSEIDGLLAAYAATGDGTGTGIVATPTSTLVTGYDFMTRGADAVESNFQQALGSGATNDTLIQPDGDSPSVSWTASDLESKLLTNRHDLIFLAGHFSANNTLAADFSTTMNASDLANSSVDLENSIVFSAGCHSGYNIASEDAVPGVTQTLDWVGAFAQKQATLIAGTGYQYGDTDFLAYSEQLYADFSAALLSAGSGPTPAAVSVGDALVSAKNTYLDATPSLHGIDIKSLLEATIYGLPMLSVRLPTGEGIPSSSGSASVVSSTTPFTSAPGAALNLSYDDLDVPLSLSSTTVPLVSPTTGDTLSTSATYLSGPNGVTTSPAAPTLPLAVENVSDTADSTQVLRGVGFEGGTYTDTPGITPLTGAPATELSAPHTTFSSSAFYPGLLWTVNYFGGLTGAPASTLLDLTPGQYETDPAAPLTDIQRQYSDIKLRLFYSSNLKQYTSSTGSNTPGLAAPPTIERVDATVNPVSDQNPVDSVTFQVHVVGDPSAGIQQVWVTYTGVDVPSTPAGTTGEWESRDLTQDSTDSTLWSATLDDPANVPAAQFNALQFVVQAVNGVGLVSLDDNQGSYYQPDQIAAAVQTAAAPLTPTTLTLNSPPPSGNFNSSASLSATLTDAGGAIASEPVSFTIGGTTVSAMTNGSGVATAQVPLTSTPGSNYQITAGFSGDTANELAATSASTSSFTINQLPTTLALGDASAVNGAAAIAPDASTGVTATLANGSTGLPGYPVEFVLTPTGGGSTVIVQQTTVLGGVASLGAVPSLGAGDSYTVEAFFGPGGPSGAGDPTLPADPIFLPSDTAGTSLTLSVGQAAAFTSPATATFTVGQAGSFPITTSGSPAVTSITNATFGTGAGTCTPSTLPSSVTFTASGAGATLAGTPAAGTAGTYTLCLNATNGVGSPATQKLVLTIQQPAAFTSPATATFVVGQSGMFSITTSGSPAVTSITNANFGTGAGACTKSTLPASVTFTASGAGATLAGTPAAGTAGTYTLCLNATNGVGSPATQKLVLTIQQAAAFTSPATATFVVGQSGTFSITTSGSPAVTSITNANFGTGAGACTKSTLPASVTFTASGAGATLAGTPAAGTAGTYTLCLNATNAVGSPATQKLVLTIQQPAAFTSPATATFVVGQSGMFSITTSGSPAVTSITNLSTLTCTASTLPANLTFTASGAGATLAGTPAAGTGGTYTLCLNATNGVGSPATQKLVLTVQQAAAFTSVTSATFTVGQPGTFFITTSGVPAVTSITNANFGTGAGACTKSTLPASLTFTASGAGATLAGTPAAGTGGTYTLCLNATNGVGSPATQKLVVTVSQITQAITFTSKPPASPTVGGTYVVTATGGGSNNPVTFSIDSSSTAGACSISAATVTFTGAGSCVVDANQLGNTTYQAAPQVHQTMTVTVTAAGIATLALTYVQSSAAYQSASAATKSAITAAANALTSILASVGPHLSPAQNAVLEAAFKAAVAALESQKLVTAAQAATLDAAASEL
jgi:CSLREA domain-containing protein